VGTLIVGLAGGTWYFVDRGASQAPETQAPPLTSPSPPVETTAPARQPAGQPAETGPQPTRNEEPAPVRSGPARPAVDAPESSSAAQEGRQPQRIVQPNPAETNVTPPPIRGVEPPPKPEKPTVDPKKISAAIKLGDFFLDRGAYDDAIQEYQRGLNLDPTNQTLKARIERARRAKAAEERLNQ
jgi:hypothetical protein